MSLEVPFGPFFFGAGAAWRQQERPIRGRAKGGGAQRTIWGLTRGGWVYIGRVGDSKMEIPVQNGMRICSPAGGKAKRQQAGTFSLQKKAGCGIAGSTQMRWMQTALTFLSLAAALCAQANLGTITGLVTDTANAVVPGARVTVRNLDTNMERTSRSSASGDFTITNLAPGNYELTAEMAGFRTWRRTGIVLEVGQVLRIDVRLQLAALAESVEVTAEIPAINAERGASQGDVITQREIQELPLQERDFMDLAFLVAGVVPMAQGGNGSAITAGGARSDNTNMYVDGFSIRDSRRGLANARPNVDTVQEFRMETAGYSAEYGRFSGGVLSMALRSGGNRFHSVLFESLRNKMFDSRSFFDPERLDLKRNQFGATFSGPLTIPKIYEGRNRTFFIASWEGFRQVIGESAMGRVPTALERTGDFTASRTAAGAAVVVRDPYASGSAPFPGNRIPPIRFHPVAVRLLDYYPLPNRADPRNNFLAIASEKSAWDSIFTKLDHRLTANDSLTFRYQIRLGRPSNPWAGSDLGTFGNTQKANDSLAGLDYTHIFSPALLLESRGGYSRTATRQRCIWNGQDIAGQLGIVGTTTDPELVGFPRFTVSDHLPLGCVASQPVRFHVTNIQVGGKLTWIHDKHVLKWGYDVTRLRLNQPNNSNARGTFVFQDRWTGYPVGDFLLGLLNSSSRLVQPSRAYLRETSMGAFFNDDYRATRSLTLNVGMRYELNLRFKDRYGRMSNFVPGLNKIVIASDQAQPGLGSVVRQAGLSDRVALAREVGLPKSLTYPDYTNLAPRFGFAWRPLKAQQMVIRGGYGFFYGGERLETLVNALMNSFPFSVSQSFSRVPSDPAGLTLSNPFPEPRASLSGATNTTGVDLHPRTAYLQSYNLAVERELRRGVVLEIAYTGSKGTHLVRRYDINQPVRSLQLYQLGIPFQRPFSGLNTVDYYAYGSNSIYSAGQLSLRRRAARGLFYRVSYTYAKSIDDASQIGAGDGGFNGAQDARNLRSERGRSDWDRGHAFSAAFSWPLPLGRGRRLPGGAQGLLGALVNHWQVSGIITMYTGAPFTVLTDKVNLDLGESQRPNRLGSGKLDDIPGAGRRGVDYPFFRLSDFEPVPRCESVDRCLPSPHGFSPFSFGNSGRNILDGPGFNNINLALMRNFRLGENQLQLRCEVFNAFNHPNFRLPNRYFNALDGGMITSAQTSGRGGPRVMQLYLRLEF